MPPPDTGRTRTETYLAHVVPGLEELARREIVDICGHVHVLRIIARFDERTGLLCFSTACPLIELLGLRLIEDLFFLVAWHDGVPPTRAGLAAVRSTMLGSALLERAASRMLAVRPKRGKVSFRVIARAAGGHTFRRIDLQRAVERALEERFPAWRLVEDNAHLEVWVHLVGTTLVIGIRLSDITMRRRTWRRASLPAALKPTVAAAMAVLSAPQDDDVVLDPMCGTGTILIERAELSRYRLLLGGDRSVEAVDAARTNIGRRYKPIEVVRWDATRLNLDNASVSAIITNMPFGKQIGSPEENATMYPVLLSEWSRVLANDGRMVLLTGDRALLMRSVRALPELTVLRELDVLVRGFPSTIAVLRKTAPATLNRPVQLI